MLDLTGARRDKVPSQDNLAEAGWGCGSQGREPHGTEHLHLCWPREGDLTPCDPNGRVLEAVSQTVYPPASFLRVWRQCFLGRQCGAEVLKEAPAVRLHSAVSLELHKL